MKQIPPAEISGKVMTLFDEARVEVIVVSPYNQLWKKLENRLRRALERGVKIVYYVRENEDHQDLLNLESSHELCHTSTQRSI